MDTIPEDLAQLVSAAERGIGCVQSYARAINWYRRSAAQGLGRGSWNLGACYLYGHGVPADRAVATAWFEKALEQGDELAADMLKKLER